MTHTKQQQSATGGEKRPLIGIVVNHTHWDREWYMPFQRYRVLLVDAVDLILDTLATRDDFAGFLLDGQTVVAQDYLEVRPERRAELEAFIRAGRLVLGPWYVLPDEFIPSGESLIRNLLLGRRQMADLGMVGTGVGYLPDTFGHPAQLPQLLAGFDLNSCVIFRGVQSDTSEFLWEAPDGTRLLTIYLPGGYYNAMELARSPRYWLEEKLAPALDQAVRFATAGVALFMNGCDHFECQPATQEALDEANRMQDRVLLRQGTLAEYVRLVQQANPKLAVKRGEWRFNRPARITPGVLSSRMYLKQADFRSSTLLERGAEPLQALVWALGGRHDTGLLRTAWSYLLQNHPHDSICGCSTDEVHADCEARFRWAQQIGGDLVERAANRIAQRDGRRTKDEGPTETSLPCFVLRPSSLVNNSGFALFNTLARPRREIVSQRLHFLEPGVTFSLTDSEGRPVAYQVVARRPMKIEWDPQRRHFFTEGRARPAVVVSLTAIENSGDRWRRWFGEEVEILFAADLPAGGYIEYRVPSAEFRVPSSSEVLVTHYSLLGTLLSGPNWLENVWLRIDVQPDGSFDLLDKSTGRRFGPLNVFRSEADRGDEYSFCPAVNDVPVSSLGGDASIELIENGPVRATLEIRLTMQVPARLTADRTRRTGETVPLPIRTRLSLGPGRRRVEISTEIDNTARDHRLRALFSTGIPTDVADAQGQFQVMSRPVELAAEERARVPQFDEEQEVSYHPQRAFVDVSDGRRTKDEGRRTIEDNGTSVVGASGFAVLNRGLPEYEAEPGDSGVRLGITLLRCVGWLSRDDLSTRYKHAGPALETPGAQCLGRHSFAYAVMPHAGDWLAGGVAQETELYVTPIYSAASKVLSPRYSDGASFYSIEPAELMFSAFKRSDDGRSLILRVYNTAPYPVEGTLMLGIPCAVRRSNLAEREVSEPLPRDPGSGEYRFSARAHEIVTLSLQPEQIKEESM